ncbi:MAG: metallopeptidase TldD-related protein, partial [Myxococcota bacterium]
MSLSQIALRLLDRAQHAGASAAEVLVSEQQERVWSAESGGRSRGTPKIEQQHRARARVTLRAYREDGRLGVRTLTLTAADNAFDRIDDLAKDAVQRAANAPTDPLCGPPQRMDITDRGLSIADPRHSRLTDEDRQDIISWNWGTARSVSSRIRPQSFALHEFVLDRTYHSTRGVEAAEHSTRYEVHGAARSANRGDWIARGQVTSRHFADIASRPLGAELGNRLEAGDRATRMPAEAHPLVFEPYVIAEILPLLPTAFDATRLDAGESFLQSRFGARVAPAWFNLTDDAAVNAGLNTRSFDDRGVPPIPVPLIREGILTGVYLNPRQARARDTRPTGHATFDGGLWSGNLELRPGTRSRNMVFAELNRYLVAVDLIEPPTLDVKTGALEMKVWLLLDGPERNPGRLGAYRIQTNALDFIGAIVQLASDQTRFGATVTCTTVTEGL